MARNGSGTFSILNSFVPSTTISSSAVNANFTDIGTELTNSVAVDGQSTMIAPLKHSDGTALLPSMTFGSDPNTGVYRKAADSLGFVTGGTEQGSIDSSGNWTLTGDLTITGGDLTIGAALVTAAGIALIDDVDAAAQRTTLGLGTIVTQDANNVSITGGAISGITDLAVADGGTGASTAAGARTNLGAVLTDAVFPGALVAIIEDQKAQNTAGGTFTSGADRTRVLNTLVYNRNTAVTLSSNQFTLPAGSWDIEWEAPASEVDGHQSWLFDITGTAVAGRGGSSFGGASANGDTMLSRGNARVAPSGSNTYEIRHRCTTTGTFGRAANFGTEVYTRVIIRAA